ncbi:MAG: hypothetical protein JWQ09_2165, partial [Segetibacter sp.]|nr:hypothetical protein [Segetibacter sp.]
MKKLYFTQAILMLAFVSRAQYSQNFDQLTNTGSATYTTLPDGWGMYEVGTGAA